MTSGTDSPDWRASGFGCGTVGGASGYKAVAASAVLQSEGTHRAMTCCSHTEWTRLWQSNGRPTLETTDRPVRLLEEVANDWPAGFAVLIGNHTKSLLLSNLCPTTVHHKGPRHHGEIHLHVSRVRAARPTVIADGDLPAHNRLPTSARPYRCHEATNRLFAVTSSGRRASQTADEIYQKLLFPFVDVVCLFVADVGGPDRAMEQVAAWMARDQSQSAAASPVLLLVVPRGQKKKMQKAVETIVRLGAPPAVPGLFQRVTIVTFTPSRSAAGQRRQLTILRRKFFETLDTVQESRRRMGALFAARHTVAFLQAAVDGVDALPYAPVDVIRAARQSNPVASDLSLHLTNWLTQFDDDFPLERVAIPLTASSLILDQYPPGMHRKYNAPLLYSVAGKTKLPLP